MKRVVLGLLIAASLLPGSLAAQAVTGTILGTITDTTGAVMPGTTVTLRNTGTGLTRTVTTDAQGEYTAPQLPTGKYAVSAELSGFKTATVPSVDLGVDQRVRINVRLEVGAVEESVTVTGQSPLVQTSSSELGTTVAEEQIRTLPLNGRNFVNLTRTVPGVVRGIPGANIDGAGSLAWRASASFSANGQRPRDNNYMLDGVDNNETWLQTVVLFPSVDALDEFKLQTSTYSAEFGRSLGGVVNLQIKSGTNTMHGSGFEFLRNDAFDANNFFNNRAGRPKPDFSQHQFGGTVGGPIVQNKTFYFFDYQGYHVNQGATYLSTVPSDKMRAGDFSEINRTIYDPITHLPFANNTIPASRFDPAAKNIIDQLIPAANTAGTRSATGQIINNYLINPTIERQDNQIDLKVDHMLAAANRFFARYSYQKTHRVLPATMPHGDAGFTFGAGDGNIKAQGLAFNDTHTFSSNWLNEFRFGWSSIKFFMTPVDYGGNVAQKVGIPGVNLGETTSAMSQILFTTTTNGGNGARNIGANSNQPLITNQNDFQFFDNVTRVAGKHTMKAGGSITKRSREILNADTIVGQFTFNSNQTSNCAGILTGCTPLATSGFDVASFMLGLSSGAVRTFFDPGTYTEQRPEYAAYFQDDIRLTSRLTINAGLRYDVYVPWVEKDNKQSNFDVSTGRFVVASDNATINGVEVGRYLQTYAKTDFGPRLGFAYDLNGSGRTIIRGGYGLFWNFTPGGTSSSKAQNQPFLQAQANTTSLGTNIILSQGLAAPPGVHAELAPGGSTRSAFLTDFRDAHAHNFNVNVQRQFGANYMIETAYSGARTKNAALKTDLNQAPPTVGVTDPNVNRPFAKLSPALRTVGTLSSTGYLEYNGLLIKFQRRSANHFSFLNSYTLGKAVDLNSDNDGTVTLTNIFDPEYNRGPSDYDVRHTFSSNWIYELPWGAQRAWGGWQVSGILYLRSGLPLTITQAQTMLSTGISNNRPNTICDPSLGGNATIDRWFNTSCFQQVADTTGTFGNTGRNTVRGPGDFNIDFSAIKNTRLGRVDSELRLEVFNVLNHPQFGNPNTTFGNSAFGTVSAMLASPSCATCGTTERQVQLAVKLRF